MLEIKGKIHNGAILPLEPISDVYEGKEAIITIADEAESENQNDWDRLFAAIEENQIDADIIYMAQRNVKIKSRENLC